jgi:5-methylcytosine-specific restriction endonuclease McrA
MSTGRNRTEPDLYDRRAWRRRSRMHRQEFPLCQRCLENGIVKVADAAHHIQPHRGDAWSFYTGQLQSLCNACHALTDADLRRGFSRQTGLDGWPVDREHHPVYQQRQSKKSS